MKKLLIISSIVIASVLSMQANSQVHVGVHVNIGSPAVWAPAGYQRVQYYYMPDIETYYYVPRREFIYQGERGWVHSRYLPSRYSHYNLRHCRKIVMNRPAPYLHHSTYGNHFVSYREPRGYYRNARFDYGEPGRGYGRGHAYGHYREHWHGERW